jgi:hypothetical protein
MKKLIYFPTIISITLLLNSCDLTDSITGNGEVTTETRALEPFTSVSLKGVMDITISQADTQLVQVIADENLIRYIVTRVENGTLIIMEDEDVSINSHKKLEVHVTLKDYMKIENSGVGNIEGSGILILDSLSIVNDGVGNFDMAFEANSCNAENSGVGNLTLNGKCTLYYLDNSGVGNAKTSGLNCEIVHVKASGVGDVSIFATKELYLNKSGVGNLYYKGEPVIKEINITGTGSVTKE